MNVNEMIDFIAVLLIFIGSVIAVISAIGLIRFPDIYNRAHAGTKAATLAVLLTLSGVFIYFWVSENYFSIRLLLGIIFVFMTSPVSGHLVTRAAYRSGVKMADSSIEDELGEAIRKSHDEKST